VSDDRNINELERIWKEEVMAYLRYHPGICLEELKKTIKTSVKRQPVSGPRSEPWTSQI
jgi:hypothetical protein